MKKMNAPSAKSVWVGLGAVTALAVVVLLAGQPRGSVGLRSTLGAPDLPPVRGVETAVLTEPPFVPPPIQRDYATHVVVNLKTVEVTKELAPGVQYRFWTFGGTVPGKFIRVREGDEVEIRLSNDSSSITPHNIDIHAVTGPGGGATATFTGPGQETSFTFRAVHAGLFVYHCAMPPAGMHIANGMYGMMLVEPAEGLPPVDREFYVMQGEFYTEGAYGAKGLQQFSYAKALAETPDYVVFNGAVGSLNGEGALQAQKGDRVRLYVGNAGPSLTSSFHIIGEIMENVYPSLGSAPMRDVQTVSIPAGDAVIAELRADVPGAYTMVDHAIFRAFDKGANGTLQVSGDASPLYADASAPAR
jgi:nitrite reductase (NO-forming)